MRRLICAVYGLSVSFHFLTKVNISFSFELLVPAILVQIGVGIVLLYRRVWYGYTCRRIKLTRGKYALVDVEDVKRLNQYGWYYTYDGYARRTIPTKSAKGKPQHVLMPKELCPVPEGVIVDHINRNPSDNRKANLRPATRPQNCWNANYKSRRRRSRYIGIYFDKRRGKWRVHMSIDRFLEIWYSPETRKNIEGIKIY